ncbi:MAG: DUF2182 domain-containing protein [Paracoccaceae bacterium]
MEKTSQISLRGIYWLSFFGVILLSWGWLYSLSHSMDMDFFGRMNMPVSDTAMEAMSASRSMDAMTVTSSEGAQTSGMSQSMDMPMPTDTGVAAALNRFIAIFGMWAVMMAAMMLPTMVPTLKSYEDLMLSANGTRAGWLGVVLGYGIVWVAFAACITAVQMVLLSLNLIDMMGLATSIWLSAALLIVAGAFQFTRAKEICHGVCHSPMMYFLGHWKTGFGGGLRMGLGLGAFCVGCCWLFMVLGFAGGVMNFLWMGLATLFMVFEKLPEIGHRVVRPMGFLLILAGLGLAVWNYHTQGVV